jgi:hypothetical protein
MPAQAAAVKRNGIPDGQQVTRASTQVPAGPARVTLVTAPGCHFCEDAAAALGELARECPLAVEEISADSPAGQSLLRVNGTGMLPLVLVDWEFFSAGRLPRRKLARLVAAPGAAAAPGAGGR